MKRKIVTVCGSMRFMEFIQREAERLELEEGYAVVPVVPHVLKRELTEQEMALLGELHRAKIDVSDAVYVVNPGGYIGESVKREIEYARMQGKEILYFEPTEREEGKL